MIANFYARQVNLGISLYLGDNWSDRRPLIFLCLISENLRTCATRQRNSCAIHRSAKIVYRALFPAFSRACQQGKKEIGAAQIPSAQAEGPSARFRCRPPCAGIGCFRLRSGLNIGGARCEHHWWPRGAVVPHGLYRTDLDRTATSNPQGIGPGTAPPLPFGRLPAILAK